MLFTISYTGLTDASKGNPVVINMSCFNTKRILLWMVWNPNNNVVEYLVNVWILEKYPAFVKCPMSDLWLAFLPM
jgi:hypothetical protein